MRVWTIGGRTVPGKAVALALILVLSASGCSGGKGSLSGKVTAQGNPVTGGVLLFAPTAEGKDVGKPVEVIIKEDGSYVADIGAVVGSHRITYTAPILPFPASKTGQDPKQGEGPPKSPFDGMVPKEKLVDITAGSNVINVELMKPK